MKESRLWKLLSGGMADDWVACRHEDKVTVGIPDVSYAIAGQQGWIELKLHKTWPKQEHTIVRFDNFTTWQRRWIESRGEVGGNCWVFVRIENDFLLFSWGNIHFLGSYTKSELIKLADYHWHYRIKWHEFKSALIDGC